MFAIKKSPSGRPNMHLCLPHFVTLTTVMLLQAYEELSDREACDRLAFDLRWKAAAGLTVDAPAECAADPRPASRSFVRAAPAPSRPRSRFIAPNTGPNEPKQRETTKCTRFLRGPQPG